MARGASAATVAASSPALVAAARAVGPGHGLRVTGHNFAGDKKPSTLVLQRFDIFRPGAVIEIRGLPGSRPRRQAPPDTRFFRGHVQGEPSSSVMLSVRPNGAISGLAFRGHAAWALGNPASVTTGVAAAAVPGGGLQSRRVQPQAQGKKSFKCGNDKGGIPQNHGPAGMRGAPAGVSAAVMTNHVSLRSVAWIAARLARLLVLAFCLIPKVATARPAGLAACIPDGPPSAVALPSCCRQCSTKPSPPSSPWKRTLSTSRSLAPPKRPLITLLTLLAVSGNAVGGAPERVERGWGGGEESRCMWKGHMEGTLGGGTCWCPPSAAEQRSLSLRDPLQHGSADADMVYSREIQVDLSIGASAGAGRYAQASAAKPNFEMNSNAGRAACMGHVSAACRQCAGLWHARMHQGLMDVVILRASTLLTHRGPSWPQPAGFLRLWTGGADTDPWPTATDSATMLTAFKSYWDANMTVRSTIAPLSSQRTTLSLTTRSRPAFHLGHSHSTEPE